MKGCLSLLVALLVLAALLAGGYWLYTRLTEQQGLPSAAAPELTITNQTAYPLTVRMTTSGRVMQIQILPGRSERRTVEAATYTVEGRVQAPDTSEFTAEWTFERGGKYTAGFQRSGDGGLVAVRPGQQ